MDRHVKDLDDTRLNLSLKIHIIFFSVRVLKLKTLIILLATDNEKASVEWIFTNMVNNLAFHLVESSFSLEPIRHYVYHEHFILVDKEKTVVLLRKMDLKVFGVLIIELNLEWELCFLDVFVGSIGRNLITLN